MLSLFSQDDAPPPAEIRQHLSDLFYDCLSVIISKSYFIKDKGSYNTKFYKPKNIRLWISFTKFPFFCKEEV